ncbi:hypothetical protein ACSQ67_000124 [Phaseolus vulgaris]
MLLIVFDNNAEAILQRLPVDDYLKDAEPTLLITSDQVFVIFFSIFLLWFTIVHLQNITIHKKHVEVYYCLTFIVKCDLEVVVYEGVIREKPTSKEEARQFLKDYSGKCAATVGSVLVTNIKTGFRKGDSDRVEIYFNEIPDEIIEKLVDDGITLNVAGGLIIEHPSILPFVKEVFLSTVNDYIFAGRNNRQCDGTPQKSDGKTAEGGSVACPTVPPCKTARG